MSFRRLSSIPTSRFVGAALLAMLLAVPLRAGALETAGRQAIIVDYQTGTVLFEKNADEPMAPASMSKLMTVYLVFEQLKSGRISMEDTLPVSEKAWRKGGSKMFVEVNSQVKIADLLRGIIVQSGNDACIVVAEGLAGSVPAFAELMNKKARELGLTGSHFVNASGWPDPEQKMTARDLAVLAKRIIQDFPEYYEIFSEKEFTYNGIRQGNRNPLLYRNMGADGLKTGHTEESGYGLTASAERNGRRIILVVHGLGGMQERADESARLIEWAFREFANYEFVKAGETIATAPVWLGESETVPLVVEEDLTVTLPRGDRDKVRVVARFDGPVPAPIEAGQVIGELEISAPGIEPRVVPLLAGAPVERLGPGGRIIASFRHLLFPGGAGVATETLTN
jgi:D-alanyl-D-alanine carboxypeptidase (penicillin-binding protein 5/6)